MENPEAAFVIHPIGAVRRAEQGLFIDVFAPYRPGLYQLGDFSHVIVLWWAAQNDTPEARNHLIGPPALRTAPADRGICLPLAAAAQPAAADHLPAAGGG